MVPDHPDGFHGNLSRHVVSLCRRWRGGRNGAGAPRLGSGGRRRHRRRALQRPRRRECFLLSDAETRRVAEIVSRAIGDRAIVVSGVNHEGSREAADLAREVVAAGADAIMVFPPNAWASGQDGRVALHHHRVIVEAVDVPVMLFQGPAASGFAYPPEVLAELVRLPRVVAIKDGSWEVAAYEANRRLVKSVAPHVGP